MCTSSPVLPSCLHCFFCWCVVWAHRLCIHSYHSGVKREFPVVNWIIVHDRTHTLKAIGKPVQSTWLSCFQLMTSEKSNAASEINISTTDMKKHSSWMKQLCSKISICFQKCKSKDTMFKSEPWNNRTAYLEIFYVEVIHEIKPFNCFRSMSGWFRCLILAWRLRRKENIWKGNNVLWFTWLISLSNLVHPVRNLVTH